MSGFQDINIKPMIQNYQIENFIETGCYTGDGIAHALRNGINTVYSCDINKKYVDHCKNHFPGSNVIIQHAHSVDFLLDILNYVPGPCLFWLDAHFPDLYGMEAETPERFFPLIKEVELLSQKPDIEKDVIIIDDIRVIISDDNPIKQDFDEKYKIYNYTLKQIIDLFPKHDCQVINVQEGMLFFTPKT